MIINLSPYYGLISICGPDAFTFLQGQLTCDMATVTPGETVLGAFCNPKGRIRAIFRIFKRDDRYFLYLPLSVLPQTLDSIKKYAKFSKVTLQDESTHLSCWGTFGANADNFIDSLRNNPIQNKQDISILTISALRYVLIGTGDTYPIIESFIKPKNLDFPFSVAENENGDFEAWKSLDIENLIPEIWPETIEQFLPHDIGLVDLGAVSFKKGCYCGQEIIARMEYRGKSKKQLVKKLLDNTHPIPVPGTELDDGIVITSCCRNNTIETLLQIRIL